MLNLFEHCFHNKVQSHFQHLSITENCILYFCYYYLLNCCVQDMHENYMLQILSNCKHLVSSLNLCKLLMKQVFKILYHLAETFLFSIISCCVHELYYVHAEQHVFSAFLTFITYSFSFHHHNLLLCKQKCIFLQRISMLSNLN